jgi:hypothetical protein
VEENEFDEEDQPMELENENYYDAPYNCADSAACCCARE